MELLLLYTQETPKYCIIRGFSCTFVLLFISIVPTGQPVLQGHEDPPLSRADFRRD